MSYGYITTPIAADTKVASDLIGDINFTRNKLTFGDEGAATDVSAATPLPTSLASQPLPTGASTEATLAAISAKLPASLIGGSLSVALGQAEYETVAASQTDQMMGASGAVGDYLAEVLIIPGTTSPGAVSIKDGNGAAIVIFAGGASSVSNLVPFAVPLGIRCTAATTPGWKLTTGANVTAIGVGDFS